MNTAITAPAWQRNLTGFLGTAIVLLVLCAVSYAAMWAYSGREQAQGQENAAQAAQAQAEPTPTQTATLEPTPTQNLIATAGQLSIEAAQINRQVAADAATRAPIETQNEISRRRAANDGATQTAWVPTQTAQVLLYSAFESGIKATVENNAIMTKNSEMRESWITWSMLGSCTVVVCAGLAFGFIGLRRAIPAVSEAWQASEQGQVGGAVATSETGGTYSADYAEEIGVPPEWIVDQCELAARDGFFLTTHWQGRENENAMRGYHGAVRSWFVHRGFVEMVGKQYKLTPQGCVMATKLVKMYE